MSNKAIFFDRDGTLIEEADYINHPDQVKLIDGVAEALIELSRMGYKLIVASNQSAVARGIITEKVLDEIHSRLKPLLAEKDAHLDQIYYCPYHPDGVVAKYRKESDLRKPNPGMLLAAADQMDIDLSQSWVIGNSICDIEAGLQTGCKTILIRHPSHYKQPKLGDPKPDYGGVNIKEAVNIIKKYNRSSSKTTAQTQPTPQITEQLHQPEPTEMQTYPAQPDVSGERTEQLLDNILRELKTMQRVNMFGEFSVMRLIAGVVQIIVLFCLLISIWFLMSPARQGNSVLIVLGFAMVLQMMALTFYMMQGRK